MILLTDGSLLIHNAYVSSIETAKQWLRLIPDQNGKYQTGSWSAEIDMKNARQWFASGVLKEGRVYTIGGEYSDDPLHSTDSPLGETFDLQTNQWTAISKPSTFDFVRGDCNGSVLEDGRVLLGGAAITVPPSTWAKRTAIWNPANNTGAEAGTELGAVSNTKTDPFEEETFALLPHGSVLAPAVPDTPKAQRYVPLLDRWVNCAPSPVKLAVRKIAGAWGV
jgi:Galactose oxidase, central domain